MTDQTIQDQNQPTRFGARLKAAREALHLSPKDAGAHLHLNPRIINIIENEDFTNGPPAIFMRGYLRSYARLLSFSDADIEAALKNLGLVVQPSTAHPPCLQTERESTTNDRYITWVTYLVIFVSVILVGIWWSSHPSYRSSDLSIPMVAQIMPQSTTDSHVLATNITAATLDKSLQKADHAISLSRNGITNTTHLSSTAEASATNSATISSTPRAPAQGSAILQPDLNSNTGPSIVTQPPSHASNTKTPTQLQDKLDEMNNMDISLPEPGLEAE